MTELTCYENWHDRYKERDVKNLVSLILDVSWLREMTDFLKIMTLIHISFNEFAVPVFSEN